LICRPVYARIYILIECPCVATVHKLQSYTLFKVFKMFVKIAYM
jgi:hypothetical protein